MVCDDDFNDSSQVDQLSFNINSGCSSGGGCTGSLVQSTAILTFPSAAPEPSSLALLPLGLGAMLLMRKRTIGSNQVNAIPEELALCNFLSNLDHMRL